MMDLLLNPITNDLVVIDGEFAVVSDFSKSVAQAICVHLKYFRGEWFLDQNHGPPTLEILGRPYNAITLLSIYRTEIAKVYGVKSVKEFDVKIIPIHRTVQLSYTVELIDGSSFSNNHSLGSKHV